MRLASLAWGGSNGTLIVVSRDGRRFLKAGGEFATLRTAIEQWEAAEEVLSALALRLDAGDGASLSGRRLKAPIPRGCRWLDAEALSNRSDARETPSMRSGISRPLLGPVDEAPLPEGAEKVDFTGEFGVIVDQTPMGVSVAEATASIRLLVQINSWRLRDPAGPEKDTIGRIQTRLARSAAPFAITPDELGKDWRDGRVHLDLTVSRNGRPVGVANGGAMGFSFGELIAHAASARPLRAGTVISSGPVSKPGDAIGGSACIAEIRALEISATGAPATPFVALGDRVRMEATAPGTLIAPFGAIDQVTVEAPDRRPRRPVTPPLRSRREAPLGAR